jgi:glycosyltransferase involved in cell wall biosynthesis
MRIVLNLLPLKSGGGVQVALDFLSHLGGKPGPHHWHAVARAGTPFFDTRYRAGLASLAGVPDTLPARVAFDLSGGARLASKLQADVVYTLFGPPWRGLDCPAVSGCAHSNLLYPEIDFWADVPFPASAWRRLKDRYRMHGLVAADGTIFETEDLAARAVRLLGLPAERVTCVKPKASVLVGHGARHESTAARLQSLPERFHVLALSGYHPNKRLHLIPEVLRVLECRGERGIGFITTLGDSPSEREFFARAERDGVRDLIFNVGPLPPEGCVELYRRSKATLLASRLESFSNNIAEAWVHGVPLLASDLDWAHAICGDAAAYFRFDDSEDLARCILELRDSPARAAAVTAAGRAQLAGYPDAPSRHAAIVAFLERIVVLGKRGRNG